MLRFATGLLRRIRQRPGAALVVLALAGALGAFGGVNLWAYYQLWTARRDVKAGHYEEALTHVNRCLRFWWRSGDVHLLAARIERLNGHYPAAEKHLQECQRRIKPATEPMQLEWLLLRAQQGDVDEVRPGLLKLVQQNHPESNMILETLARSYLRQQRYLWAFECLNQWLARDSDNVRALLWRAFAHQHMNGKAEAVEDFERVLELDPGQDDARLRLADMLLVSSSPTEALPHLEKLRQRQPDNPAVLIGLARCRQIEGKKKEVHQLLQRVLDKDPENVGALYYLGMQELSEPGRRKDAEATFRHILKIEPNNLNAIRQLYTCLAQQKDRVAEATNWQKKLGKLELYHKRINDLLAHKLEQAGPQDAHVPAEIGELLLLVGKEKEALYWLEGIALKRDPDDRRTHEILAEYYASRKNLEHAEEYAKFHRDKARGKSGPSEPANAGSLPASSH
jgi:tetratricopeptide (TPR) repeat protein